MNYLLHNCYILEKVWKLLKFNKLAVGILSMVLVVGISSAVFAADRVGTHDLKWGAFDHVCPDNCAALALERDT